MFGAGNDALDADAVLPGGLEGAAHKGVDDAREIGLGGRGEHDGGVFAAELGEDGDQGLGGRFGHLFGDGLRADEGDVADFGVRGDVVGGLGPADDGFCLTHNWLAIALWKGKS